MRMTALSRACSRARSQDGFTMIIALGVMLVTSLLLAATFVAARGDIQLSHTDTAQKEAYYASLAGVQEFEYQMQVNPNYWQTCGTPTNTLPQEEGSSYKVKILPAASAPTGTKECSIGNPFGTVIESSGAAANTFRIESVGTASKNPAAHHSIIATFKVTGFLNFIYYTNHEDEDPALYSASPECKNPNTYYPNTSGCTLIEFATGDSINGPMHTNDAACVGGSASFGRSGHSPPDLVEFYRGTNSNCGGTGTYYTATKKYTKGELLTPPTSDSSLETYAAEADKFSGVTELTLNGSTNTITVINNKETKTIEWPTNGLIYVKQVKEKSCEYTYNPLNSDEAKEAAQEVNCGNVYVSGTYSKSLTIGSSDDVIIKGSLYPTGNLGGEPTGTATLGLIANNYVRVYHPVESTYPVNHYIPVYASSTGLCGAVIKTTSGKITSGKTEVTNISSTSGLAIGMEVSGSGIPSGTTITRVNTSTTLTLSKSPSKSATEELTFSAASTLVYNENLGKCIAEPKPGYEFHESELEDSEPCHEFNRHEETYLGKGICESTENVNECDAENLNAEHDLTHGWGSLENPWIYAAILSTTHSFVVDNFKCGENLGKLHIQGAIAQNYRGIVGTGSGDTGYLKDYKYDQRLAVDEPPYFLSPLNAGWKVSRETASTAG
jgi:hypothetical protein